MLDKNVKSNPNSYWKLVKKLMGNCKHSPNIPPLQKLNSVTKRSNTVTWGWGIDLKTNREGLWINQSINQSSFARSFLKSKDPSENLCGFFFMDYLAWCINTLRLSYQNANKRQKILLHRDLLLFNALSCTISIFIAEIE
jgi:hypothetical protein